MGHPAGDALLKQVAQRLERTIGAAGRVGRLGGDEFQVILPGRIERDQLAVLAGEAIEALSQPYSIDEMRVSIGVSVGIAIAPDDGLTSEALIRNADLALYAAKDAGRGRFHFYASDLHSDAEERRQLEQDLRDAIANGGLELHYQPVLQTSTERITGFEALLRWEHPQRGWISPAKFIPLAKDTGLITPIGEWALRTACHELALWPDDVRVAVNVSPLQFANPSLPAIVTQALAQAGVQPNRRRSARSSRQPMLRKVQVEHGDHFYPATIRNISRTGALVEGLWNVPKDTIFRIRLSADQMITATARWSQADRMGVEFSSVLELDDQGRIGVIAAQRSDVTAMADTAQRKTG